MNTASSRMVRPPPRGAARENGVVAARWPAPPGAVRARPATPADDESPAPSAPVAVARIRGARVFGVSGAPCGRIGDLSIEKGTGRIVYALVGEEGWFGSLERLRPIPWPLLRYDAAKAGYVIPAERADVFGGPDLSQTELRWLGAGDPWQIKLALGYDPYLAMPFF